MVCNSLETAMQGIRSVWGPLATELVASCRRQLQCLLRTAATETWLSTLHREAPSNTELYRDRTNGFVLLAHTEHSGLYRPPHDHGRGWVIYAVQQGEVEMGTYARIDCPDGSVRLVKRNSVVVRPGQVQVYLPGDIHDTRCVKGPALLFRFADRDLKREDKDAQRVTRYVERDGQWTVGSSA